MLLFDTFTSALSVIVFILRLFWRSDPTRPEASGPWMDHRERIYNRKRTVWKSAKTSGLGSEEDFEMKNRVGEKGQAFPVDPNLPRWLCQNCHHSLCFVGADSYVDKYHPDPSSRSGEGSCSTLLLHLRFRKFDCNSYFFPNSEQASSKSVQF